MKDTLHSKKTYATASNAYRACNRDGKKYAGWKQVPGGRFVYLHTVELPNEATLIDVLNNPEGRELVDAIEDLNGSLDGKEDATLEEIRADKIAELRDRFGFEWRV